MSKFDKLQRIPMFDYPDCDYIVTKNMHFDSFNQYVAEGCTIRQAVNGHYYHGIDYTMNEHGMDKFVAMLAGMLFMIENNDVEPDQAYGTNYDIKDFESGEYDDLFTHEDLKLIKEDIRIIKEYLSKNQHLLDD